jgi:hypothetical protein
MPTPAVVATPDPDLGERLIPILIAKSAWATMENKFTIGTKFGARVDCDALAMAWAECTNMLLVPKVRNSQNLNLGCKCCDQFAVHFGARGKGSEIGPGVLNHFRARPLALTKWLLLLTDGDPRPLRHWVLNKAVLTHTPECKVKEAKLASKKLSAYNSEILMYALLDPLRSDLKEKPKKMVDIVHKFVRREPSLKKVNQLKRDMLDKLDPGRPLRGGLQPDTEDCNGVHPLHTPPLYPRHVPILEVCLA